MSKARGVVQAFEPSQVAGIDTRIWQEKGTSTDNRGVNFTLRGEVATVAGIRPLVRRWREPSERFGKNGDPVITANPFEMPVASIGTFSRDGITDILVDSGGKISIIRGDQVIDLLDDRHIAENPWEATRFFQVANNLILINGKDPNMKWDGEKMTPLGIKYAPSAPRIVGQEDGDTDVRATAPAQSFWSGNSMVKTATDAKYNYKISWVSEFGQESELSGGSNSVSDSNVTNTHRYLIYVDSIGQDAPQDDIIGRNLYRSTNGIDYYFIRYIPGSASDGYIDSIDPTAPLQLKAPDPRTNTPPPLCRFGFYFRGRTYYSGNAETPTALFYSKDSGEKEAVPAENVILVGTDAADPITGFAIAGDYVLIFKEYSTYMLTQDKNGKPILTPISDSFGCVSDRAAVGFEGRIYFVSKDGLYAFDGSKVVPISKEIGELVKGVPKSELRNSVAWVEPSNRRVNFSIVTGPKSLNNEVWTIHVDNGAMSRTDVSVNAAVRYKDMTIVGYSSDPTTHESGANNIGVWGVGSSVRYYDFIQGTYPNNIDNIEYAPTLKKTDLYRKFQTRWMFGSSPQADKTFYRIDVFYAQTGGYQEANPAKNVTGYDHRIYVKWFTDWDRNIVGEDYLDPSDPNGLLWDESLKDSSGDPASPVLWGELSEVVDGVPTLNKPWDEARVRSKRINIRVTNRIDPLSHLAATSKPEESPVNERVDSSGENITAKSLKVEFSGGGSSGWRIVGFLLHMQDHGIRSEGTDHE